MSEQQELQKQVEAYVRSLRRDANPVEQIARVLAFYRPMGFFTQFAGRDEADVVAFLADNAWLMDEPDKPELNLLPLDERRVWARETIVDDLSVSDENGAYTEVLEAWGRISRGVFAPESIREHWGEDGALLEFENECVRHKVGVLDLGGIFDLGLVMAVNGVIHRDAARFCVYDPPMRPELKLVIALTPAERERIENERGVRFWRDVHFAAWRAGALASAARSRGEPRYRPQALQMARKALLMLAQRKRAEMSARAESEIAHLRLQLDAVIRECS